MLMGGNAGLLYAKQILNASEDFVPVPTWIASEDFLLMPADTRKTLVGL